MNDTTSNNPLKLDVEQISQELRIRPEIYMKIVSSFANSLGGKMRALGNALAVNDADQMRMILHEIKGTAGNLRLHNIAQAENTMHVAVKAGESHALVAQYFDVLRAETERLQQYVARNSKTE